MCETPEQATPCRVLRPAASAPLPGQLGRISAIRSLGYSSYRRLWAAGLLLGFGNWMQRLTIGWLVLDETGSVVPDAMRGRVVGGWVFAIGFGWLGALELGALSAALVVQAAMAINGAMLAAVGAGLFVFSDRLRRV